jgi:hypothetical protein
MAVWDRARCIDFLRRREVRSRAEEAGAEPDVTGPVVPAGPALGQDWDGLRALIAADATLRVADLFEGPLRQSPYFTRYANLPAPLFARLSDVDGQPALVLYPAGSTPTEPRALIRITINDDRIVHVTDYTHCPWVIAGARYVSPIPPGA